MKGFVLVAVLMALVVAGGMKLAGLDLPIIDYPLGGGPLNQPQIEIVDPDLNLP